MKTIIVLVIGTIACHYAGYDVIGTYGQAFGELSTAIANRMN